jgi:hypothetical protein
MYLHYGRALRPAKEVNQRVEEKENPTKCVSFEKREEGDVTERRVIFH